MTTTYVETKRNPGCLLQILWFAFIGIWLGQIWMVAAWLLMISIIGLPLGIAMTNKVPKIIALREPSSVTRVTVLQDGTVQKRDFDRPQLPFVLRALYFILVGWWLSALWMETAYLLCLTIVGLPIGFWMFDVVPSILTLRR